MAGRRRDYSGLAAGLNLLSAGLVQDAEDRRKFNERLQEAGIKAGIKAGTIAPIFQGGQFTGFGQMTPKPAVDFGQLMGQLDQAGTHDYQLSIDSTGKYKLAIHPKKSLSPQAQYFQDVRQASEAATAPTQQQIAEFHPQAIQQLQQTLPTTPFVPGPEEGFITGSQVEALPGSIVPRPQVVEQMASSLTPQLQHTQALNRLGTLQSTAQLLQQSGAMKSPAVPKVNRTDQFRADLKDAMEAVAQGRISRKEARTRLQRAYGDKISILQKLEDDGLL